MMQIICPLCRTCSQTCWRLPLNGPRQIWRLQRRTLFQMHTSIRYNSTSSSSSKSKPKAKSKKQIEMSEFPVDKIRNFSIIAHVDHGKSTLADRLLEFTGAISTEQKNEQVLDKLQVERERGITVKAQTASLVYEHKGISYLLNLIDTPGHVDFNYEVSRSLAACQGVILLVDANHGIQAQTLANFYLAFEAELAIIPVINKIDLKVARPEVVAQQIQKLFDVAPEEILKISAKHGTGVEEVLQAVIEKIPPPVGDPVKPLKGLLFDSWFERYRGAVCSVSIKDGVIKKGDRIVFAHSQKQYDVQDIGIMHPDEKSTDILYAGQVGYMCASVKTAKEAQVGDTFYRLNQPVEALPGFKAAKPMVFAGIYPMDQSELQDLRSAIDKLTLNDSSVEVNIDTSAALGQGWRLGFLGLLHMDVFCQRLEQEHDTNVIMTTPNVPYKVKIHGAKNIKLHRGDELTILNPCNLPDQSIVVEYQEPMVMATIICPDTYLGSVIPLILSRRGEQADQTYIDDSRLMFKAVFPLSEVIVDFFDELKSLTSGYASFDYEDHGFRTSNLVKLEFLLNGQLVEEFTQIAHVSTARAQAKKVVAKLQQFIPRQQFEIAVQGKVGGKILARANIKAYRKDVTAKLYGGDVTRRNKLLQKQTAGKKQMRLIGRVAVPKEAFLNVLKK